jgi:CRP-like cAMP-binding protein
LAVCTLKTTTAFLSLRDSARRPPASSRPPPHRVGVSHEAHVSHPVGPGSASRALDGELVVNRLLAALPGGDFDRIARSLRAVPVVLGQVVQRDGEPVDTLYFPNGCVLSVTTVMDDGSMVEIATLGREGLANITALLHDGAAVGETMIQVASGGLFALPIDAFRTEIERDGLFCQLLTRYAQAFLFQGMRATACNALHDVEHRCARWLLETQDRVGAEEFALSHEFLSIMLGVHRPTVSIALGTLQRAGFIQSRRGVIHVLDRGGLEEAACECYGAIRAHFESLAL